MGVVGGLILGLIVGIVIRLIYVRYARHQKEVIRSLRDAQTLAAAGGKPVPWVTLVQYKPKRGIFGGIIKEKVMVMARDQYEADSEIRDLIKSKYPDSSNLDMNTPEIANPKEYNALKKQLGNTPDMTPS